MQVCTKGIWGNIWSLHAWNPKGEGERERERANEKEKCHAERLLLQGCERVMSQI